MSASLVGSEMCIRDSTPPSGNSRKRRSARGLGPAHGAVHPDLAAGRGAICLLYTSDAADDM
eukprot:3330129-Alexandrium_andersonii.AAC.1